MDFWSALFLMLRSLTQVPNAPQLYRCWVVFSKNLWVIAFPSLMYIGAVGMHLSLPRTGGDTLG